MAETSKGMYLTGWVLSAIPGLMMITGGVNALVSRSAQMVEGMTHLGYTEAHFVTLGVIEIVCAVLYLVPRTSVLGAILLTGYFGGAVASHFRIGEGMWVVAAVFGVVTWLGLWLRDVRLRVLLPLS